MRLREFFEGQTRERDEEWRVYLKGLEVEVPGKPPPVLDSLEKLEVPDLETENGWIRPENELPPHGKRVFAVWFEKQGNGDVKENSKVAYQHQRSWTDDTNVTTQEPPYGWRYLPDVPSSLYRDRRIFVRRDCA